MLKGFCLNFLELSSSDPQVYVGEVVGEGEGTLSALCYSIPPSQNQSFYIGFLVY